MIILAVRGRLVTSSLISQKDPTQRDTSAELQVIKKIMNLKRFVEVGEGKNQRNASRDHMATLC